MTTEPKMITIPLQWLETLQNLRNNVEYYLNATDSNGRALNILLGYLNSVDTIIKYNDIEIYCDNCEKHQMH